MKDAGRVSGIGSDFLLLDPAQAKTRGLTGWLADALREAISDGRLEKGSALPASRTLSRDLGVSRGMVVQAYQRLADEGLITGTPGSGTIVTANRRPAGTRPGAETLTESGPAESITAHSLPPFPLPVPRSLPAEIDLSPGVPDLAAFPRAAWLRAERAVLEEVLSADLGYGDPRGILRLRTELATWLARTRGLRADADTIIVVAGVAQSLALIAQTLVARGRPAIAVEDPGSRGAREELAHWGAEPVPVAVDAHGLDVGELIRTGLTTAMLTPAHQYPTGVVLAPHRRLALLEWAADGGLIIEDDYDAEHRYDRAPVPALQAGAPEHVAHTGSTSKTLAPGLRLGWLVPPAHLQNDLVTAKHASDLGSPALPQLVLAHLLASGQYDRHLRTVRTRQRRRRDTVVAALREYLPEARIEGVAAGLHLLITLGHTTSGPDDVEIAARIREVGVLVQPMSWHRHRTGPPGLLLGYAANSPDRLYEAVRRIGAVVHSAGQESARSHES